MVRGVRVNGFLALASPLTRSQRALLAQLSLKHRVAGMFGTRENVEAGRSDRRNHTLQRSAG